MPAPGTPTSTFGMFYYAMARGLPIKASHALEVNVNVALELFYLFSVRYVQGALLTQQDGLLVVAAGVVVFLLVIESEKRVRRALGMAES